MEFILLTFSGFVLWATNWVFVRKNHASLEFNQVGDYISAFFYRPFFYAIVIIAVLIATFMIKRIFFYALQHLIQPWRRMNKEGALLLLYASLIGYCGYVFFPRLFTIIFLAMIAIDTVIYIASHRENRLKSEYFIPRSRSKRS